MKRAKIYTDPKDLAIHRALSFLQTIVDDEPFTIGEADRVMEVLRNAICRECAEGRELANRQGPRTYAGPQALINCGHAAAEHVWCVQCDPRS